MELISRRELHLPAIELLKELIAISSFSKEEHKTADRIYAFLAENGITASRKGNNVWAKNKYFDEHLPTILLNSHHDTVKPNTGYTRKPFEPIGRRWENYMGLEATTLVAHW